MSEPKRRRTMLGASNESSSSSSSSAPPTVPVARLTDEQLGVLPQGFSLVLPYYRADQRLQNIQRIALSIICRHSHLFDLLTHAVNSYNDNVVFLAPINDLSATSSSSVPAVQYSCSAIEIQIFAVDEIPHWEHGTIPSQYNIIRQQLGEIMGLTPIDLSGERFRHQSAVRVGLIARHESGGGILRITLNISEERFDAVVAFYHALGLVEQRRHYTWPRHQFVFQTQTSDFWQAKPEVELFIVGASSSETVEAVDRGVNLLLAVPDIAAAKAKLEAQDVKCEESSGHDQYDNAQVVILTTSDPAGNQVRMYQKRDLLPPRSRLARILGLVNSVAAIAGLSPLTQVPPISEAPSITNTSVECPRCTCCVCLEANCEYAMGCGHVLCTRCLERIEGSNNSVCPKCRSIVSDRLRLFL